MLFLKKNLKVIIAFIFGIVLTSGVLYATISAKGITYKNGKNVEDALNDLYRISNTNIADYKEVWFACDNFSGRNCNGQIYNFETSTNYGFHDQNESVYLSIEYPEAYHYIVKAKVKGVYDVISANGLKSRKKCEINDIVLDFNPTNNCMVIVGYIGG